MDDGGWRSYIYRLIIFTSTLFHVLATIAMFFYPGGINIDPCTTGYSFAFNFYSDLGRWTALCGDPNLISLILFLIIFVVYGISFSIFGITFSCNFKITKIKYYASPLSLIAGIGMVMIPFFPLDL